MRRQGAGQWTTGWNGFHPCEGQRIPGLGGAGGAAESPGAYWERLDAYEEEGWRNGTPNGENGGRSGSNRSKRIGVRPRSG